MALISNCCNMYIFYVGYNGKIVISTTNKVVLSCPDVKWFVLKTNEKNVQLLTWNLSYYNKLLGEYFLPNMLCLS
jgi:hypothetical protein